jgi:DNA-binding GntR family transcriptional regulator
VSIAAKPLSPEEALDIAELRLALISLAAKPAYRHLSPADFDSAYGFAKQITRSNSAKEHFQLNRQFWNIIFGETDRPILWDVRAGRPINSFNAYKRTPAQARLS